MRWFTKGHVRIALLRGFSMNHVTDLAIDTRINKHDLVQISFPAITNGNTQQPYWLNIVRWCWKKLMHVKDWHGIANQASPLCAIRSSSFKLLRNPITNLTSCSTGSLAISNPCLGWSRSKSMNINNSNRIYIHIFKDSIYNFELYATQRMHELAWTTVDRFKPKAILVIARVPSKGQLANKWSWPR